MKVTITTVYSHRFGETGTVVSMNFRTAQVRFKDGKVETFGLGELERARSDGLRAMSEGSTPA